MILEYIYFTESVNLLLGQGFHTENDMNRLLDEINTKTREYITQGIKYDYVKEIKSKRTKSSCGINTRLSIRKNISRRVNPFIHFIDEKDKGVI